MSARDLPHVGEGFFVGGAFDNEKLVFGWRIWVWVEAEDDDADDVDFSAFEVGGLCRKTVLKRGFDSSHLVTMRYKSC